jgi:hypothetical protein
METLNKRNLCLEFVRLSAVLLFSLTFITAPIAQARNPNYLPKLDKFKGDLLDKMEFSGEKAHNLEQTIANIKKDHMRFNAKIELVSQERFCEKENEIEKVDSCRATLQFKVTDRYFKTDKEFANYLKGKEVVDALDAVHKAGIVRTQHIRDPNLEDDAPDAVMLQAGLRYVRSIHEALGEKLVDEEYNKKLAEELVLDYQKDFYKPRNSK